MNESLNYMAKYGLYVFNYDPQAQPANNTDSSDLSPGMKTAYSDYLIKRLTPKLVFAQFCEKEKIPEKSGKTIQWRMFVAYKAANVLTEGVTPDPTDIKMEFVSATVIQLGAFTPYTDYLDLTHADNIVREVLSLQNDQAALTIDLQVRNELSTSSNVIFAPIIDGDTVVEVTENANITNKALLTGDVVLQATTFFEKQNAPTFDDGYYVMAIHPSVAYDFMRHPLWVEAHKYADPENIYAGEIGKLFKFRFVTSNNVKVTKDGMDGGAVYHCLALAKDAAKMCDIGKGLEVYVKQLGSSGTADPLNQRATIGWKLAAFAVKLVRPNCVCRVVCGSTYSGKDSAN